MKEVSIKGMLVTHDFFTGSQRKTIRVLFNRNDQSFFLTVQDTRINETVKYRVILSVFVSVCV